MLISTLKTGNPTSFKFYQGKGFLLHTQPCGVTPPIPPPLLASLKLFAKIHPVEVQDCCTGPGDWTIQMSKVNSADLKHSKNTKNRNIL